MFGNLHWQNAFNPKHVVSWRQIPDDVLPTANLQLVNRNSSMRSVSRDCSKLSPHPDTSNRSLSCMSASSGSFEFFDQDNHSRNPSPELEDFEMNRFDSKKVQTVPRDSKQNLVNKVKKVQTVPRDSKQNLVNKVEPMVDALIGGLYAREEDYRANRSGRFGPPVLRGDDVLFIPAKKQISLENVVEFIEAIQSNSTIVAASKVCQKKKKRQKKGFLIYLKLSSADEALNVLEHVYAAFKEKMPGVKHAVFEKPNSESAL